MFYKNTTSAISFNKKFPIVLGNEARTKFYVFPNTNSLLKNACTELSNSILRVSGTEIPILEEDFNNVKDFNVFFFFTIDEFPAVKQMFPYETDYVINNDGYAVMTYNGNAYVFSSVPNGVFYGAMAMLEYSIPIIWANGFNTESEISSKLDNIYAFLNFYEKPYFELRGWNFYSETDADNGVDLPMACVVGKNKCNTKMGFYDKRFKNYALNAFGVLPQGFSLNFDSLISSRPEFFMTDVDGEPKSSVGNISFLNYYRHDVAELCAEKYLSMLKECDDYVDYVLDFKVPNDVYFYMVENGVVVSEQPFYCDDGTTILPYELEYKSTVYWNFVNRVIKIIAKQYPNIKIKCTAINYAELCPKIKIDSHIIVCIPTYTLDGHMRIDSDNIPKSQKKILDNIKNWCGNCDFVVINEYWQSFNGEIYSRPNLYIVQANLRQYYLWGVKGIVPDTFVSNTQYFDSCRFYNMNGIYFWVTNKLMWNFDADIETLIQQYCDMAYGKASVEMQKYYELIQKGWDSRDSLVVYQTTGDIYIKEFIIKAGIVGLVKETLNKALQKKLTPLIRNKIQSIQDVFYEEVDKYSYIPNEDAVFKKTNIGIDKLLSNEILDYKNNTNSPWNCAGEINIFKDCNNLEDYDPKANLCVKLLYDDSYLYFGYTVYDDLLSDDYKISSKGIPILNREDGTIVKSVAELYVGADSDVKEKYCAYISGVLYKSKSRFFINEGAPEEFVPSKAFREAFYSHYDKNPQNRYYFHVQAIPFIDLGCSIDDIKPYGSIVYYSNRYGRAGWKGNGLWAKACFSDFYLE